MKLDLSKYAKYIGETTSYDKKEKLEINKSKSWLKSVSAFTSGRGGKLIFGVRKDNTILGVCHICLDKLQKTIHIRKLKDRKEVIFLV